MGKKSKSNRSLVDITLEEAMRVMDLGEGFRENTIYKLRTKIDTFGEPFAQLYFIEDNHEKIAANFSDDKNAVSLCQGNTYYRTIYRVVKYLEKRGFDLKKANSTY